MQYTLKPSDIYSHGRPNVPEGWKVVAFRPPLKGESYFVAPEGRHIQTVWSNYERLCPHLIVERMSPAPAPAFSKTLNFSVKEEYGTDNPVIPEGWQAVAFRFPVTGDNFLDSFRTQVHNNIKCDFPRPRLILVPAPKTPVVALAATADWWE